MATNVPKTAVIIVDEDGDYIGPGAAGASTIADAADVTQGAIADAAVVAGATGSVSAKLRSISRDVGALTETAPASDTASSGLNGRLQRIAQNITTNAAAVSALATTIVLAAGSAIIGKFKLVDASNNDLSYTKSSATVGQNTLSTSAELVVAALATRMHVAITNTDATIKVYWGQTTAVTSATGDVIMPGATVVLDGYIGDVCCVGASATPLVTFREY